MTHSDQFELPPKLILNAKNEYTGNADYDTLITVFDGHGTKMGEAFGTITLGLPRGLYSIRVERFGEIGKDLVIVHKEEDERILPIPRRHSAMPSTDTSHTHEFLQASSQHFSRNSTWDEPGTTPHSPRLMILVRSTGDGDHAGEEPARNLALFNDAGVPVTRFGPDQAQGHANEGWVAFSARITPGNYILSNIRDGRAVSLPLMVHSEWDTLVFVPFETHARLSAASIDLRHRGEGYDANDRLTQQIDAAMQGLGQRLNLLDPGLRQAALYGKFDHPLLGLIGAHAHFLGDEKKARLESQVLHNLWRLLPGSVDVIALLLMAQEREDAGLPEDIAALDAFGQMVSGFLPLRFPPMLRSGLNSLIRASQVMPDLIAADSWLESAAMSSYADGAWSVWDQETATLAQEAEPEPVGAPAPPPPPPPSRQKLYPAIKRALAAGTSRRISSIRADDRLRKLVEGHPEGMGGILNRINRDLEGFDIDPDPEIVGSLDRVRDLAKRLETRARPSTPAPDMLDPDTRVPQWLVDMVRDRKKADGADFDPRAVARMAGVPLRSVKRAEGIL
jgi:hypothetical protein